MRLSLRRFAVEQPYEVDDHTDQVVLHSLLSEQPITVLATIPTEDKSCKYTVPRACAALNATLFVTVHETYKKLVDMFRDDERLFFLLRHSGER